jgi:hypothetical protein
VAERDDFLSLGQAARWLCDKALEFYPDSDFAREYLRSHPAIGRTTHRRNLTHAEGAERGKARRRGAHLQENAMGAAPG